jgi:uncharacterized membrane protein
MSLWSILPWWIWLTGTLGLIGTLALVVFVPGIAAVLGERMVRLGVRILSTTIGKLVVCAAVFWTLGYFYAADSVREICNQKFAEAAALAKERDRRQGEISDEDIRRRLAELEEQARRDQEELDAYKKLLAARPPGACTLTPDDIPGRH